MPKGGGAIRGIGEKFGANPVTGTGSMSVPIATSPGRSGFGPQLSLTYDSGAGNGPFGFGWTLVLPSISRKTDKGLPQYDDAVDSDVFLLSGAEDLVPVLVRNSRGDWERERLPPRVVDGVAYEVRRFRPRIEGLFARIERWANKSDLTGVFWRSISKDNITTWYGKSRDSRIADPADATHIFSWLICQSHDDRGNVLVSGYKPEDSERIFEDQAGVTYPNARERNRTDPSRSAQRYLKRIRYANRVPYFPELKPDAGWPQPPGASEEDGSQDWHFEVVFDYGDHDALAPTPVDLNTWLPRSDPFSTYRSGFEIRTYRTCQRVLMFHHFPDEAEEADVGSDCLVWSTGFTYSDELGSGDMRNPVYTFLHSVTQTGYRRTNGVYDQRSVPPVEFRYSKPIVQDTVEQIDPENLPIGLDGSAYRWTDLHGEGIPGILTEQAGAWYYKRNLSPISDKLSSGREQVRAKFAPIEAVALKPNAALRGGAEFMDLAGDGQPDVVVMDGPAPGFYEHDNDEGWQPFRQFTSRLNRNMGDPNLKFIDLDGDGHADVMITESDAFVWHASLAEEGFGPARRVVQALDEEQGPRIVFADGTQSIYLADLSGDGLTDIVRIRNGEVCYWPNLGYGRFGAKVTMDDSPWFDHPDQFDHKRVRVADIDGSGTTNIIYLHRDGVRLYFNQSGNSWSQPQMLNVFPRIDDLVSIVPVDLLGNGTACLVWSSPMLGDARRPMRYVNLMGDRKPHLLVRILNNLGAETHVDYAPSTKFYLRDKRDGKPWIARLPFPVHVIERVTTFDRISGNRFVTSYNYHHGHFDGEEREFRGFGLVEQQDTEAFGAFDGPDTSAGGPGDAPPEATNNDLASHVPPVLTKTWFHTGIYLGRDHVSDYFAGLMDQAQIGEYYREPGLTVAQARKQLLPDTVLPSGLPLDEEREACRAFKGSMLRQEVYALDSSTKVDIPYAVTEQNFSIEPLQPRGGNRHAVFFAHAREALTHHYERNPVDPRIGHALTLEVDPFGNVLRSLAVAYGRRKPSSDPDLNEEDTRKQTCRRADGTRRPLITYTLGSFTENNVPPSVPRAQAADHHRAPLPAETRTYELTGFEPEGAAERFSFEDWSRNDFALVESALELSYELVADQTKKQKRLVEHVRALYRKDDLCELLPLRKAEARALPGEAYKLALTPPLIAQVFKRSRPGQPDEELLPDPAAVLAGISAGQGGFVDLDGDGHWWIPAGRGLYHPSDVDAPTELAQARAHFFVPRRYRDPFGHNASVDFDNSDLLMVETRDALGNRVTVDVNDYRVLQPRLVSDPNRNQTEVAFDTLGMVVATAVMGKAAETALRLGDSLGASFELDPPQLLLDAFITKPREASADPGASVATQAAHDLLGNATSRIVYDLTRYMRVGEPPFAATIARETHVSDLSQGAKSGLQISFSYSDGFGREIQRKIQAEPGPAPQRDEAGQIVVGADGQPVMSSADASPRWVGSGWTVFNNKGKPVRQFEPFFTDTHHFESDVRVGISPVLFYDPVERVIATLHPNHTYDKVVFDPWQQTTWGVNDIYAPHAAPPGSQWPAQTGDPRTDPDIGGYVGEYFKALPVDPSRPWQTWYAQRIGNALGLDERNAAERAAAHAGTPTTAHFDVSGRPFLTVARNRVTCKDHPLDGKPDEAFRTRVELDIEVNQREVRDERKLPDASNLPLGPTEQRIVMRYSYDMLGNRIHQLSMEAGARWMLGDVAGMPVRAWDSRGHNFTTMYDALRRPIEQWVRGMFSDPDPLKPNSDPRTLGPSNVAGLLVDRIEYGEPPLEASQAEQDRAQLLNLRTRIYRHFDGAGVATNARFDATVDPTEAYDFKGNLLFSTRQLVTGYKDIPDWGARQAPLLDAETFEGSTRYDALNRPIHSVAPHSSLTRPGHPNKINIVQLVYNEASLLERVDVWLERTADSSELLDPAGEAPSPVGVAGIDYDAKGQRLRIDYKNGASTRYSYDPFTYCLTHLLTRRIATAISPGTQVQNLHYTYDPSGNITHIQDDAQQAIYFRNQQVEPSNDYIYDAIYRLVNATGREHLGQLGGAPIPHTHDDASRVGLPHPGDGQAMGTYIERYVYDAVGNFFEMQHRGSDPANPGWTRRYAYDEASLGEPARLSNRLSSTTVGAGAPVTEPYV